MHLLRRAVEITRSEIPVLPLAAVGRQLDGLAVAAVERLVDIQHRLRSIVTGRHIIDRSDRITSGVPVNRHRLTWFQAIDGHAEDHLRARRIVDLHPWLIARIVREQEQHSTVQRLRDVTAGKLTVMVCARSMGVATASRTTQKRTGHRISGKYKTASKTRAIAKWVEVNERDARPGKRTTAPRGSAILA